MISWNFIYQFLLIFETIFFQWHRILQHCRTFSCFDMDSAHYRKWTNQFVDECSTFYSTFQRQSSHKGYQSTIKTNQTDQQELTMPQRYRKAASSLEKNRYKKSSPEDNALEYIKNLSYVKYQCHACDGNLFKKRNNTTNKIWKWDIQEQQNQQKVSVSVQKSEMVDQESQTQNMQNAYANMQTLIQPASQGNILNSQPIFQPLIHDNNITSNNLLTITQPAIQRNIVNSAFQPLIYEKSIASNHVLSKTSMLKKSQKKISFKYINPAIQDKRTSILQSNLNVNEYSQDPRATELSLKLNNEQDKNYKYSPFRVVEQKLSKLNREAEKIRKTSIANNEAIQQSFSKGSKVQMKRTDSFFQDPSIVQIQIDNKKVQRTQKWGNTLNIP